MLIKRILTSACIRSRWAEKKLRHITFVYIACISYLNYINSTTPQFNLSFLSGLFNQITESLRSEYRVYRWHLDSATDTKLTSKLTSKSIFIYSTKNRFQSSARFNLYLTQRVTVGRP